MASWVPFIINIISGLLIIVSIILDFVAADRSRKNSNTDAEIAAIAAGIFSIIGLIGLIVAAGIYRFQAQSESQAPAGGSLAKTIQENPELLALAL